MNFIGFTENKIREELTQSQKWLFDSEEGLRIIRVLESNIGKVNVAYVLQWIPDQCNSYLILVNGKTVVELEVPYQNDEEIDIIECQDVKEYQKDIEEPNDAFNSKLRLMMALGFSQNDEKK